MGLTIDIDGLEELDALLDVMSPRDSKKFLQKAVNEGAKFIKPKVPPETPLGPGHFGYHLKKRVFRGPAKKDRPAAIVKYRSSRAHWLLLGTRGHSTKRVRDNKSDIQSFNDGGVQKFSRGHDVPSVAANPVMSRVADRYGGEAMSRVEEYLVRAFGLDE
jgi:hypothetical protein